MAKNKRPKPTNNDFIVVINSLIEDIHSLKSEINGLVGAFDMYVEYNKDETKFREFLDTKIKGNDEIQATGQDNTASDKADITNQGWWSKRIC